MGVCLLLINQFFEGEGNKKGRWEGGRGGVKGGRGGVKGGGEVRKGKGRWGDGKGGGEGLAFP